MSFQPQPQFGPTFKSITFVNPINQYMQPQLQKQNKQILYNNANVVNTSQINQINNAAKRYHTPFQVRQNLVNGIKTLQIKSFNTSTAYNPPKQLPNQNYITRTFTNQNKVNNLNIINPLINGRVYKISNNQTLINGGYNNHNYVNNMAIDQNLVNTIGSIKSQNVIKNISNGQNVIINNVNNNSKSISVIPVQKVINTNIIKNPNMTNGMVTNQNTFKSINGAPTNISLAINNSINPLVKPGINNNPNNANVSLIPKINAPVVPVSPLLSQQNLINNLEY